ncbi:MAG: hypothetical protein M3Y60_07255, partial [Bacteroidota bacterium]|nr:hypothetical protein [Bacteroidota bacterium]
AIPFKFAEALSKAHLVLKGRNTTLHPFTILPLCSGDPSLTLQPRTTLTRLAQDGRFGWGERPRSGQAL